MDKLQFVLARWLVESCMALLDSMVVIARKGDIWHDSAEGLTVGCVMCAENSTHQIAQALVGTWQTGNMAIQQMVNGKRRHKAGRRISACQCDRVSNGKSFDGWQDDI